MNRTLDVSANWQTRVQVLVVPFGVLIGAGIGTAVVTPAVVASLVVIMGCLALPWLMAPLSLVVLGFAGRFEMPPFAVGMFDIAYWTLIGLSIRLLVDIHAQRRIARATHIVSLSLTAFAVSVAVSLIPTLGHQYAGDKAFRVILYSIAFLVVAQAFLRTEGFIERFLIVLVVFVTILAYFSVALTIQERGLLAIQRISPPGGGPITLARLIGFAVIASLGLAYFHRRKRLLVLNAGVLTLVAFATGSRGPALFLVLLICLFPLLAALNRSTRRQSRRMVVLLAAMAVLLVPSLQFAIDRSIPFAIRFMLLFKDERGTSVRARQDFLDTGLQVAKQFDYLGSGIGSWPLLTSGEDKIGYPHNIFVEVLVEQGIFGLLALVVFILAVVGTALRSLRRSQSTTMSALASIGLLSFLYALLIAQTSGDLYDNRYIWFYAGFILACSNLQVRQKDKVMDGSDHLERKAVRQPSIQGIDTGVMELGPGYTHGS